MTMTTTPQATPRPMKRTRTYGSIPPASAAIAKGEVAAPGASRKQRAQRRTTPSTPLPTTPTECSKHHSLSPLDRPQDLKTRPRTLSRPSSFTLLPHLPPDGLSRHLAFSTNPRPHDLPPNTRCPPCLSNRRGAAAATTTTGFTPATITTTTIALTGHHTNASRQRMSMPRLAHTHDCQHGRADRPLLIRA